MSTAAPASHTPGRRSSFGAPAAAVVLALAIVSTADALAIFWRDMARRDFGSFYHSGAAWNSGGDPYSAGRRDLPNLNPPSVIALVFAPLARLPVPTAALVWQTLGFVSLVWCAWRITGATGLEPPQAALALGISMLTVGTRYVWLEGQITWLLLVPATLGWLAFRRGADLAAGCWLGVVIAVKPFFAVAALLIGGRAAAAAAATSTGLTLATIPVTRPGAWRHWLALGPDVSITWPMSASLWTVGARLEGAAPLDVIVWTDLRPALIATVVIAIIVLSAAVLRIRDSDARWAASSVLALLASPLGWMYYLPLAGPALVALWARKRWSSLLTAALCACCIPMTVVFDAIDAGRTAGATMGALYSWALVAIVLGIRRSEHPRER